jgi:hypothetical protein
MEGAFAKWVTHTTIDPNASEDHVPKAIHEAEIGCPANRYKVVELSRFGAKPVSTRSG